jgi:periplasmic protein TonB
MLEYVASRRAIGARQSNPSAMLIIISAHVALLAIVMSAKMDRTRSFHEPPLVIDPIRDPPPPPPKVATRIPPKPQPIATTPTIVRTQPIEPPPVSANPIQADPAPPLGTGGAGVIPVVPKPVVTTPIHREPRLLTPPWELKPPYPADKLLSEEEAVLTLRLTIDEHGRVTDVQPVGRADRSFLDAARRHLMAHWRYQPATDDSRAIASTTVITLRFMLDS